MLYPKCSAYAAALVTVLLLASCQTQTSIDNQVLEDAIRAEQASKTAVAAGDSTQLPIQSSSYTGPVKKAPTQEELIAKYKVKSVKQHYDGGWSVSRYDKKGHEISSESDYSGKTTYSYQLDEQGRVKKQKTKFKDGSMFTTSYEYDADGNVIKKSITDSDGGVSVTVIEYDKKLNTRTERSSTGTEKEFLDNRGLRVRFESCDEKGKLMGHGEATYDKDGLKVSEAAQIMGMKVYDEMEYNEAGQLLEQRRSGLLDVRFRFEYDDKGLLLRKTTLKGGSEEVDRYEYTFY